MGTTIYAAAGLSAPRTVRSEITVSSVRVKTEVGRDVVTVWNGTAYAGTLIVHAGHGDVIARRLIGPLAVVGPMPDLTAAPAAQTTEEGR